LRCATGFASAEGRCNSGNSSVDIINTGFSPAAFLGIPIERHWQSQWHTVRIRSRVAGIQVSAPFGKIETALAVIE
jgi:hypothetical protein